LLDKPTYLKTIKYISELPAQDAVFKRTVATVKRFYEKYSDTQKITPEELETLFWLENPATKDKSAYAEVFDNIRKHKDTNPSLVFECLDQLVAQSVSAAIIQEMIPMSSGTGENNLPAVRELIDQYNTNIKGLTAEEEGTDSERVCSLGVADLIESVTPREGLEWRLAPLNDVIGPPIPGTLIHVFARPETGKSAFCISELSHFAYQLRGTEKKLLYLGNEESILRLRLRTYSALLGATKDRISEDPETADRIYKENGGENLVTIGQVKTIAAIRQYLEQYKPVVCVIDQGPKVQLTGSKTESKHERLQELFEAYRDLAKEYQVTLITIGQADKKAQNRQWLDMIYIDQSKVGVQGELDVAIGIGKMEGQTYENTRYVYVSKNKINGNNNVPIVARIDKDLCRISTHKKK